MPYVERSEQEIIAVYKHPNEHAKEHIEMDDPDLMAFLADYDEKKLAEYELLQSDQKMARVIEDLVSVLIAKDLVNITDFPVAVIEKLRLRQGIRGQLTVLEDFFENDGDEK